MRLGATFGPSLANAMWLASSVGAAHRFRRALTSPGETQHTWLRHQLARHATSAFGQQYDFAALRHYDDFARRVPLGTYAAVEPFVKRLQRGERAVLGNDVVTHFAPTSGSSGARKLIPFTAELSRSFDAAVAPWMIDLARQRPALVGGPGYWSVSPLAETSDASSAIPIGFADDAEYLGSGKAWLVRQAMGVPASVRHVRDEQAFWSLTLLALLRRRDLRLISVWHPSFLELLVANAERCWPELLSAVACGDNPWLDALPLSAQREWRAAPDRARAAELRAIGHDDWPRWWPRLQVVSCWGEQSAESGWRRLAARLPHVLVQSKGLLATEGVVTLPFAGKLPLAITSNFFEFLDATSGDVRRAHQLEPGARYEVVLTNGAGLWRYRLGDLVECTGHLAATPTLRFLGRTDNVCDLRGEKLSEPFVAECLRQLWHGDVSPSVALLRAVDDGAVAGYEFVVSRDMSDDTTSESAFELARRLDDALCANPHYALARRLGQLVPLRLVIVGADYSQVAVRRDAQARSARLGDVKPRILVRAAS